MKCQMPTNITLKTFSNIDYGQFSFNGNRLQRLQTEMICTEQNGQVFSHRRQMVGVRIPGFSVSNRPLCDDSTICTTIESH